MANVRVGTYNCSVSEQRDTRAQPASEKAIGVQAITYLAGSDRQKSIAKTKKTPK
jgi:hypothetical protein